MHHVRRRIFTALILIILLTTAMTLCVYAQDGRDKVVLPGEMNKLMNSMGSDAFKWYKAFRSICMIPLLMYRFAVCGLKIMGATFLQKNEYTMNGIIQEIFHSTLAAMVVVLLPTIIGWAMGLFEGGAWRPPTPTENPGGIVW